MPRYTIGVDFGSESGRAVLVDISNGKEIATSVYPYSHSVIDEKLPDSDIRLDLDWALQDPDDYIRTFQKTIPDVLRTSGVKPEDVIGLGIDFTACTMLPTKADGTPLCDLPEYRKNPHAWVKLWKHHAAQPEADLINKTAREMGESWLDRYGGKISSEWFFSKALQIANEAPDIYKAADRLIEAADWVVWRLTGVETRNSCTAGYKAIWSKREGFPSKKFFKALNPLIENIVEEKMSTHIVPIGQKAGGLSDEAAAWTGLIPGTAVAVANVDAHVAVPAATVTEPGRMVMIMGTSTCDMVLGTEEHIVPGMCGYVEDGIIPGYFGYEAGQSCVGDHFAWFVENCVPAAYQQEAAERKIDIHNLLEEKAARLKPGESGLVALDWWNGNRSVLVDVNLTGLMLGMTLSTKPEEMYRALIEATAYGKRMIIETFQKNGVPIKELVACGGLPDKNHLLMQIYADVIGVPLKVSASKQTPALGSAMFGAVAAGKTAGGYASIVDAAKAMAAIKDVVYTPIPENQKVYEKLYSEYVILHDYFGRGANDAMKRLKAIKASVH
ncbi:ribulokinase [Leptolinea tardivitalis]|uniref:Ribulokinase n=1 Tax=Leptolinea tardivitalis TaxID=229920 RepID=A0A0N8GM12_9CHLR|nr:ribulokinase [Leptolinea tardivitalis]KPL74010.1 ribulokinase [Leptolinea tardivitalis]GAP22646.1 L-ribulokinase [Leptolinea tardivitalis]